MTCQSGVVLRRRHSRDVHRREGSSDVGSERRRLCPAGRCGAASAPSCSPTASTTSSAAARFPASRKWFESLGMRRPLVQAWLASITEVAAGASLILGLLTPLGGAGVVGTMTVAWIINHRGNGFFIFRPGEGWEYVMTLVFCGVAIGTVGAGRWSLDRALGIDDDLVGVPGLLLAGGAGGVGAVRTARRLLAPQEVLSWEPSSTTPTVTAPRRSASSAGCRPARRRRRLRRRSWCRSPRTG